MSKVVAATIYGSDRACPDSGRVYESGAVYVTGICLIIAGVLMVILAIKMAMKCETKNPGQVIFFSASAT